MARQIKETPILFGKDARRFEKRMKEKRRETETERKTRMEAYRTAISILQA